MICIDSFLLRRAVKRVRTGDYMQEDYLSRRNLREIYAKVGQVQNPYFFCRNGAVYFRKIGRSLPACLHENKEEIQIQTRRKKYVAGRKFAE